MTNRTGSTHQSFAADAAQATARDAALLEAREELRDADAGEILAWASRRFGAKLALASSFGAEDVVLIDLVFRLASRLASGLASGAAPPIEIFTLDTARLHPETYEAQESIRRRYSLPIKSYFPLHQRVEDLENEKGLFSFRESIDNRKECCSVRKVEPLRRALANREAWITGLRREQSPTRTGVELIEIDASQGGIWKLNPLANWTHAQVWDYIREHRVPYHPLHDRGFPSIGCAPCTRAISPGEDLRAGRWWWESPDHKECGLHAAPGAGR